MSDEIQKSRLEPAQDTETEAGPPSSFQSNYPRDESSWNWQVRPPGVYFESLRIARLLVLRGAKTYASATLVCGVALVAIYISFNKLMPYQSVSGFANPQLAYFGRNLFRHLVTGGAATLNYLGMMSMAIHHIRSGQVGWSSFWKPFSRLKAVLGIACLLILPNIVLLAGQTLFITIDHGVASYAGGYRGTTTLSMLTFIVYVANLVFAPVVLISGCSAVERGVSPLVSAKQLGVRLGIKGLMLLGLINLCCLFILLAGAIAFLFGLLLAFPILTVVFALHYVWCFPEEQPSMANAVSAAHYNGF